MNKSKHFFNTAITKYAQRLIEYFIPSNIIHGTEEYRKAKLTVGFCIGAFLIIFFPIPVDWFVFHAPGLTVAASSVSIICILALYILRYKKSTAIAANLLVGSIWLGYLVICTVTGGVKSGVVMATPLPAMIALLVNNKKSGWLWLLASVLYIAVISIMMMHGYRPPMEYPMELDYTFSGYMIALLAILITLLSQVFESNRYQAQQALELEKASVQRKVDEAVLIIQQQEQQNRLKDVKMAGLQHEIKMAADIQRGMLPQNIPNPPGYEVAAMLKMTREAGGDLYDVLKVSEKEYMFVIGDVSGKGMPAALYMSAALNILRTEVICLVKALEGKSLSPAELLKIVNMMMKETMKQGSFVTMFIGILNIETHELRYTNGGHDPCIVWNARTKRNELLNTDGQACGAVSPNIFNRFVEEKRTMIYPGDYLVWNTDGITEAKDIQGYEYSDERFWSKVKELQTENPNEVLENIVNDVEHFVGTAKQHDDMALLCIRRAD